MGSKEMRIAGFLRATGLPRSTVRFYERVGLLTPDLSARGNGYRVYGPQHVERARLVRLGQGLGFSIREILALLRAWEWRNPERGGEAGRAARQARGGRGEAR
jgi:DNA-binding transcriptional MerR regulator